MSLISKKELLSGGVLGVWKIDSNEQRSKLIEQLQFNKEEQAALDLIGNETRKLQWIGVRSLIHALTGSKQVIVYDEYGKPALKNSERHLSISHADELVAVIIDNKPAGIDIEKCSERVLNIRHRFLSNSELKQIDENKILEYLQVYWGAKESLYKVYGKKSLIFKKHLQITPFHYSEEGGILTGHIKTSDFDEKFLLRYEKIKDYMLVYISG